MEEERIGNGGNRGWRNREIWKRDMEGIAR